ncbi:MAG: homocysteine S-methyltransferase family protein [Candidatus Aminicenantes bacterium]|nr:homocysteine S-methyltransferase family protein [Candidatus Aminicenantes bacterium]
MAGRSKPQLKARGREKVLVLDGAMGTSIMAAGFSADDYQGHDGCHDFLSVSRPERIAAIHSSYLEAGCDIIETNTFGAQADELAPHGLRERTYEINRRAAELAVGVAADFSSRGRPRYVAGSIGPGSRLPSLQQVGFSALEDSYFLQVQGLYDGGVDLFQVETCQDMLQAKAALRSLFRLFREKRRSRPVILMVTLESNRMLLGTDMPTALATFLPFPLFAFGVNCGTGPAEMADAVRVLSASSPFPLAVMPNAGLPRFREGRYVYEMQPVPFARHMLVFVRDGGAAVVGGCCGTTPRHIRALVDAVADAPAPKRRAPVSRAQSTSLFVAQDFRVTPRPLIIGEQTNATGSRKFKAALLAEDLDAMMAVAREQADEGAHLLDLNVAYAGRDEPADMARAAARLNARSRLPLMLDSASIPALEAGLKNCSGRAVINSINLEDGGARAGTILELARDFGAAVVCLAISEKGMARDRREKAAVLKRLYDLALKSGMHPGDLFLDPLTFTLASGDPGLAAAGQETLAALKLLKKRMPRAHTLLGVSNISYGLDPAARRVVNAVFLYHAVRHGLDAAIFHAARLVPLNRIDPEEIRLAEALIFNRRRGKIDALRALIGHFRQKKGSAPPPVPPARDPVQRLRQAVLNGDAGGLQKNLELLAATMPALEILNDHLLKAMAEVGDLFEKGIMQLPFVLQAAEVVKRALDLLEPRLPRVEKRLRGCVLLATVKGDVHDIGKNLVDIILRSNGYRVINLGTDQGGEEIAAAWERHRPDHIGLSALLVRSTLEMGEILSFLRKRGIRVPVICGGAAVTPAFVADVLKPAYGSRVTYAADAFAAMKAMAGATEGAQAPAAKRAHRSVARVPAPAAARPPTPPFFGPRERRWPLAEILPLVERRVLARARWRMRPGPQAERFLAEIVALLQERRIDRFAAVYGYFPCRRRGDELVLQAAGGEVTLAFPRRAGISLADYFAAEDVLPLFIATCGEAMARLEKELFAGDQYSRYLLLHGLAVELAEGLAERMHRHIRSELGLPERQGRRFSPGYPAWPDLADQRKLVDLLGAERIGIRLSRSFQLQPELSVSAMVVGHAQAATR